MPQEKETLLSQGLGEDIWNLLSRINGLDDDSSITNKLSEMMIFDGNVLCPGSKLWALCNREADFIVFPDSATENWNAIHPKLEDRKTVNPFTRN